VKPVRKLVILSILCTFISACSQVATPVPPPTSIATALPTVTVSIEELTAAVNFQPTLPPSFTPTFTPSVTLTPTPTFTVTSTLTPTTVPDDLLCENFEIISMISSNVTPLAQLNELIRYFIPYDDAFINITVTNLETEEVLADVELEGNEPWTIDFRGRFFPDIAEYERVVSISYRGRNDLCQQIDTFETTPDELGTVTPSLVPDTPTPETTSEIQPTVPHTSTSVMLSVPTQPATDTVPSNPFQFPPR